MSPPSAAQRLEPVPPSVSRDPPKHAPAAEDDSPQPASRPRVGRFDDIFD